MSEHHAIESRVIFKGAKQLKSGGRRDKSAELQEGYPSRGRLRR